MKFDLKLCYFRTTLFVDAKLLDESIRGNGFLYRTEDYSFELGSYGYCEIKYNTLALPGSNLSRSESGSWKFSSEDELKLYIEKVSIAFKEINGVELPKPVELVAGFESFYERVS